MATRTQTQDSPKILIVGGVAGGASAAARARRVNERARIIMFERDPYVSFANCGLPYFIGGEISDRAQLLVATPELFRDRFLIDARIRHEVIAIHRATKRVLIKNLDTGEQYGEEYDKLILSPGAAPIVPPIPGATAQGVFSLRTPNIPSVQPRSACGSRWPASPIGPVGLPDSNAATGASRPAPAAWSARFRGGLQPLRRGGDAGLCTEPSLRCGARNARRSAAPRAPRRRGLTERLAEATALRTLITL